MNALVTLPNLSPFFVGFDSLFRDMEERLSYDHVPAFPPYNIVKTGENQFTIEMAVAGFSQPDIGVTIEKNVLTIKGEHQTEIGKGQDFIYRGIADRAFTRTFRLAEFVEVKGCNLKDGILTVDLERQIPEEKLPKQIEVKVA